MLKADPCTRWTFPRVVSAPAHAVPRAGHAAAKLKSLPASCVGDCCIPRWGFSSSCFVSRAGRMLCSQGRGRPAWGGALQGPHQPGWEWLWRALRTVLSALEREGLTQTDPLGSVSKGESTARRSCLLGAAARSVQAGQLPANRDLHRPSVCPSATGHRCLQLGPSEH